MPGFTPVPLAEATKRQVRKGNPPQWARALLATVWSNEAGHFGKTHSCPELRWYNKRDRKASSGWAYHSGLTIKVNAGTDPVDQRLVVLHEIAHCLAPNKAGHTLYFWRIAYYLFAKYRPGNADTFWYAKCHKRSKDYKALAERVAPTEFVLAYLRVYDNDN